MIATDMTAQWGGGRSTTEAVTGFMALLDQMSMANTAEFWHGNYGDGVKPIQW